MFSEKLKSLWDQTINPETSDKYTTPEIAVKTGIPVASFYRYIEGKTTPKGQVLIKLAKLFNVSVDYLLDDTMPLQTSKMQRAVPQVMLRGDNLSDQQKKILMKHLASLLQEQ